MSEMVERVAKAIARQRGLYMGDTEAIGWGGIVARGEHEQLFSDARAAIEATRDSLASDFLMSRDATRTLEAIFHVALNPPS